MAAELNSVARTYPPAIGNVPGDTGFYFLLHSECTFKRCCIIMVQLNLSSYV